MDRHRLDSSQVWTGWDPYNVLDSGGKHTRNVTVVGVETVHGGAGRPVPPSVPASWKHRSVAAAGKSAATVGLRSKHHPHAAEQMDDATLGSDGGEREGESDPAADTQRKVLAGETARPTVLVHAQWRMGEVLCRQWIATWRRNHAVLLAQTQWMHRRACGRQKERIPDSSLETAPDSASVAHPAS